MNTKRGLIVSVGVFVLVVIAVGGYFMFQYFEESPTESVVSDGKEYKNTRVGYDIRVPDEWSFSIDASYQQDVDILIKEFIPDSRGVEVSKYVFASNDTLLGCSDAGPNFDNCIKDAPTGAYTTVSVTYRGEETIQEVIASDKEVFGEESFTLAPLKIDGKETYIWNLPNCLTCPHSVKYVFNGADNYTYEVDQLINVNTKDALLGEQKQTLIEDYQQELERVVRSLKISKI